MANVQVILFSFITRVSVIFGSQSGATFSMKTWLFVIFCVMKGRDICEVNIHFCTYLSNAIPSNKRRFHFIQWYL